MSSLMFKYQIEGITGWPKKLGTAEYAIYKIRGHHSSILMEYNSNRHYLVQK